MSTDTIKRDLLENCRDPEYREALNVENVYATICAQIRALREQRNMSQSKLGREAKMAQERISILEDPNAETKPTLNTLLRLASAFDIGLDVRFVPFSTVIDNSTNTNQSLLEVPSFNEEFDSPEEEGAARETVTVANSSPFGDLLRESLDDKGHAGFLQAISEMATPLKGLDVIARQMEGWSKPLANIAEQLGDPFKGLAMMPDYSSLLAEVARKCNFTALPAMEQLSIGLQGSIAISEQLTPHRHEERSTNRYGGMFLVPSTGPTPVENQVIGACNPDRKIA